MLPSQKGTRVLLRTTTHTLARGFLALIREYPDFVSDSCDGSAEEVVAHVHQWHARIVLLDTAAHVNFAMIGQLRRRCPDAAVVLWADALSVEVAHQVKTAGVQGVLRKDSPDTTVMECLRHVSYGEPWFDRDLLNSLLYAREVRLSPRQRQLLRLVSLGLSNKQLAAELALSEGTVKAYLARLFRKLDVHDRYELAIHGMRSLGTGTIQPAYAGDVPFLSTVVVGHVSGTPESTKRARRS